VEWNLSPEQDAYREAFRGWLTTVLAVPALARAGHCDLAASPRCCGRLRRGRPSSTRPP